MKYYLSRQGTQVGPWTVEEILKKVESLDLSWTDYLFDDSSKEWMLLMDHPHFIQAFQVWTEKPRSSPKSSDSHDLSPKEDREWFVLKGENRYGPFKFLEMVKMLQEKNLFEYDFVWNSVLPQWKRVSEIAEFRPEKIRGLKESGMTGLDEVFFRRRFSRAPVNTSILVHNSRSVWKGRSLEISPGGTGVLILGSDFEPGQTLFLHFKAGDGVPPFNAICNIVSKQLPVAENGETKLGLKFTNISQSVQKAIKNFTDQKTIKKAS